jgi:hypothetical protein
MKIPFTITDRGVTVFVDGKPCMFATDHPSHDGLVDAIYAGDEALVRELADVRTHIKNKTLGRVEIRDNAIFLAGRQVTGRLVNRILEMVARGSEAVDGYIRFLDNLYRNPSKRAVDELWGFIEACDLPVTPTGKLLAYKKVRLDYTDIHSGTFDNSIGATPTMPRNEVDEDKDRTCSQGLHFCSYSYLPHFGSYGGDRVMVVEVDPADVVAVPADYKNAKARACAYTVVGEIEDWRSTQITPFYTDEYDADEADDEEDFEDDEEDFEEDFEDDDENDAVIAMLRASSVAHTPSPVPTPSGGPTLNAVQVANIKALLRDRSDLTMTAIATAYGVHRESIARIRDGRSWPDVVPAVRAAWPVRFNT